MKNHQCSWPGPKILGGGSVFNGMIYIRGNKRDYDEWAKLGNTGWDYESVLPYFKKSEDARSKELYESPYHQRGGYLTVEQYKYLPPIVDYLVRSGEELGYKVHDVNGENQTGFTCSYATVRDGLRCSTAKAFLRPASKRKNLHVSLKSVAEKILVRKDGASKVAYGVRFRRDSRHFEVRAKREVILSAGSIKSPQLLMLSGIGPKDHLKEMKISVMHHVLGVGQNLQDHVSTFGLLHVVDPPADGPDPAKFAFFLSEGTKYRYVKEMIWNNSGPLFMTKAGAGVAFINTKYGKLDYPDMQLIFALSITNVNKQPRPDNIDTDTLGDFENIANNYTYLIFPLVLRPYSRGYVKLKSSDPNENPEIIPNYFDDPRDLQVLIEGIKLVELLSRTRIMQKLNARPNPIPLPACSQFDMSSDEYRACYARHMTSTIYHQVGTCKMGPANDSQAVVDPRLRVYGIKGLRSRWIGNAEHSFGQY